VRFGESEHGARQSRSGEAMLLYERNGEFQELCPDDRVGTIDCSQGRRTYLSCVILRAGS
jgi:hypothetical protein